MKTLTSPRSSVLVALVLAALAAPEVGRTATLQFGDCGSAVSALQRSLETARFPSGGVDGCYGPATRYAVLAVQLAHGLRPDGVAGTLTRAALKRPLPFAARSRASGTHVEVSLDRQVLVIVRDGRIVAVYAASTGKRGYETSRGFAEGGAAKLTAGKGWRGLAASGPASPVDSDGGGLRFERLARRPPPYLCYVATASA